MINPEVTQALLPCPFCGSDAKWREYDFANPFEPFGLIVNHADDCFLALHASMDDIIDRWKIRATLTKEAPAEPAGEVEKPIPEPVASAKLGLYRVHWASGGSSLTAIGMNADGSRWIAPTNWMRPATEAGPNPWWFEVERLEPLGVPPAQDVGMLVEALRKCRDQFEFYVSAHMAKAPPDWDKAATNQEFVEICDAALNQEAPHAD